MKKFVALTLSALMMCSSVFAGGISVNLNGENVEFANQAPVIIEGRTLIPLRGVFEKLGYEISWDNETKTATFTKVDTEVKVTVNANSFTLNDSSVNLDVPAQIVNGSMMLPLRAIGEATGLKVDWDNENKAVNLASDDNKVETTEATTETTTEATTNDSTKDNDNTNTGLSASVKVTIDSNEVVVNGETYLIDVAPYIQSSSNSTMVPLRFVAVAIAGGDVDKADSSDVVVWDNENKTATIKKDGVTAVFTAGSNTVVINGNSISMNYGVVAEIKDSRMFVPFRVIGEALNAQVDWDPNTKTAYYNK